VANESSSWVQKLAPVGKQFQDAPPNWVTEDAERVHATNISRRFVIVVIH